MHSTSTLKIFLTRFLIFLQNNGVPLFLAKDVFSTCDLMQNNVQRIHARYSKEGLATKVNFEGKFIYKKLEMILHLTVGV